MEPEKIKSLPGYKKITCICAKCGSKSIIETDYLSESAAKAQHHCSNQRKKVTK